MNHSSDEIMYDKVEQEITAIVGNKLDKKNNRSTC